MEIIVDAYTQEEQAIGWEIYLEEMMEFPFEARCLEEHDVSSLDEGETVRVMGMPSVEPSLRQQFVTVEWQNSELAVPFSQLEPIEPDSNTKQAVADWHYGLNDRITSTRGEEADRNDDLPLPCQV